MPPAARPASSDAGGGAALAHTAAPVHAGARAEPPFRRLGCGAPRVASVSFPVQPSEHRSCPRACAEPHPRPDRRAFRRRTSCAPALRGRGARDGVAPSLFGTAAARDRSDARTAHEPLARAAPLQCARPGGTAVLAAGARTAGVPAAAPRLHASALRRGLVVQGACSDSQRPRHGATPQELGLPEGPHPAPLSRPFER